MRFFCIVHLRRGGLSKLCPYSGEVVITTERAASDLIRYKIVKAEDGELLMRLKQPQVEITPECIKVRGWEQSDSGEGWATIAPDDSIAWMQELTLLPMPELPRSDRNASGDSFVI